MYLLSKSYVAAMVWRHNKVKASLKTDILFTAVKSQRPDVKPSPLLHAVKGHLEQHFNANSLMR